MKNRAMVTNLICASASNPVKGIVTQDPWGRRCELDACIAAEIVTLWQHGVRTVSSCCGHDEGISYIEVEPQSVPLMIALRYIMAPHQMNTFYTRTSLHGQRASKKGRHPDSYEYRAKKARERGEKTYEGAPCKHCGGTTRRLSGHCVNTTNVGHKK